MDVPSESLSLSLSNARENGAHMRVRFEYDTPDHVGFPSSGACFDMCLNEAQSRTSSFS